MLVVDANILIRGVLGTKVRFLLTKYQALGFYAPAVAFREARDHVQDIVPARGGDIDRAIGTLNAFQSFVVALPPEAYEGFESEARERLFRRDPDDWPNLAAALALDCPLWTEDRDFFGTGVATWTSDRVEIYLRLPLGSSPIAS